MSACGRCRRPGACCHGFHLGGGSWMRGRTALEVLAALASVATCSPRGRPEQALVVGQRPPEGASHAQLGLPFMPMSMRGDGAWRFWCPLLDAATGRCTEYDRRPALCRAFEPGSDPLCVEHAPPAPGAAADCPAG